MMSNTLDYLDKPSLIKHAHDNENTSQESILASRNNNLDSYYEPKTLKEIENSSPSKDKPSGSANSFSISKPASIADNSLNKKYTEPKPEHANGHNAHNYKPILTNYSGAETRKCHSDTNCIANNCTETEASSTYKFMENNGSAENEKKEGLFDTSTKPQDKSIKFIDTVCLAPPKDHDAVNNKDIYSIKDNEGLQKQKFVNSSDEEEEGYNLNELYEAIYNFKIRMHLSHKLMILMKYIVIIISTIDPIICIALFLLFASGNFSAILFLNPKHYKLHSSLFDVLILLALRLKATFLFFSLLAYYEKKHKLITQRRLSPNNSYVPDQTRTLHQRNYNHHDETLDNSIETYQPQTHTHIAKQQVVSPSLNHLIFETLPEKVNGYGSNEFYYADKKFSGAHHNLTLSNSLYKNFKSIKNSLLRKTSPQTQPLLLSIPHSSHDDNTEPHCIDTKKYKNYNSQPQHSTHQHMPRTLPDSLNSTNFEIDKLNVPQYITKYNYSDFTHCNHTYIHLPKHTKDDSNLNYIRHPHHPYLYKQNYSQNSPHDVQNYSSHAHSQHGTNQYNTRNDKDDKNDFSNYTQNLTNYSLDTQGYSHSQFYKNQLKHPHNQKHKYQHMQPNQPSSTYNFSNTDYNINFNSEDMQKFTKKVNSLLKASNKSWFFLSYGGLLKILTWNWHWTSQQDFSTANEGNSFPKIIPLFSSTVHFAHAIIIWSFVQPLINFSLTYFWIKYRDDHTYYSELHAKQQKLLLAFRESKKSTHHILEKEVSQLSQEYQGSLSIFNLFKLLKSYFWPRGTSDAPHKRHLLRFRVVLSYFCVLSSKIASVTAPAFLGKTTDSITQNNYKTAIISLALFVGIALLSKVLKEVQSLLYLKVSQQAYIEISEHTYSHVNDLSISWHLKKKMGGALRSIDRGISATNILMSWGFLGLLPVLSECIFVVLIFFFHFQNVYLVLIVTLSLSLYIYTTIRVGIWRRYLRGATNQHDNKYHNIANDVLTNIENVKFNATEKYEVQRYKDEVKNFQKFSYKTAYSLNLLTILQHLIQSSAILASLVVTIYAIKHNKMTIGDFVTVHTYLINTFIPLNFLGSLFNTVLTSLVDLSSLSQLLSEKPEVIDHPHAQPLILDHINNENIVEFKNVYFRYLGQPFDRAIRNVSFVIPTGKTVAIVGETGSCKTTIARLLLHLYPLKRGSILVNSQDINFIQQRSLRQQIGIVPQDISLFNHSLLYNITYGCFDATSEQVEKACEIAQLTQFINSLPLKFDTQVGERGLRLSGGEKQRIAIARCLLRNLPIMVLDEATSSLDVKTEMLITQMLQQYNNKLNRSILIIAHRLSSIKAADQIIVMKFGQIVERGTHQDLLLLQGLYKSMWDIQEEQHS